MSTNKIDVEIRLRTICTKCGVGIGLHMTEQAAHNACIMFEPDRIITAPFTCPNCGNNHFKARGEIFIIENGLLVDTRAYDALNTLWRVVFSWCKIDFQEYGYEGTRMDGQVYFSIADGLDFNPKNAVEDSCIIRYPHAEGDTFSEMDLVVEVSKETRNKIYYDEFRNAVVSYINNALGPNGKFSDLIGMLPPNAKNVRVNNSAVNKLFVAHVRKRDIGSKAW